MSSHIPDRFRGPRKIAMDFLNINGMGFTNTNAINKFTLRFPNEFGMILLHSFVMLNLVQHLFFLWRNDNLLITLVLIPD
jgi:hypothetical protein